MSDTIFQTLCDLVKEDYEKTYAYVDKNFKFIRTLTSKVSSHLGCCPGKDLVTIDEKGIQYHPSAPNPDYVCVTDDGYFEFKVGIFVEVPAFNLNNCGQSFYDQGLIPSSGVFFIISTKQEQDIFIVKGVATENGQIVSKDFKINDSDDSSWQNFLDSFTEAAREIFGRNLEYRLSNLIKKLSQQKEPFGFF